jgi:hypothetical protein
MTPASLARERHTAEHEAHSPTRRTFRDNAAEGRQLWLPTVMRKKPLVVLEKLELAAFDDLRAKPRGRLQYAVGNEGKKHGSAVEAIARTSDEKFCAAAERWRLQPSAREMRCFLTRSGGRTRQCSSND